jgi:hypothetical protein
MSLITAIFDALTIHLQTADYRFLLLEAIEHILVQIVNRKAPALHFKVT